MRYDENTHYIFVCRGISPKNFMGKQANVLIVPSLEIKKWINNNLVAPKKSDPNILNIFIYPDEENKTWTYRNKGKKN